MAIVTLGSYKSKVQIPWVTPHITKDGTTSVSGRMHSLWGLSPFFGSAPGAAAVPTEATVGALNGFVDNSNITPKRLLQATLAREVQGTLILADRLSHQSGLSGTATNQTINLPTAALTRYTSGEGVWLSLEIYSQVGVTSTTLLASYTNQAGTTGRTTQAITFGGTGFREVTRAFLLPLQVGDTGVRAVASITMAASTGTAGNFGVTLLKPLFIFPIPLGQTQLVFDALLNMCANMPDLIDNTCLYWLTINTGTVIGKTQASLTISPD